MLELSNAGYAISPTRVTEAAEFGVPQYRKRMLIVGSKLSDTVSLPEPTHGGGTLVDPYNCVVQALVDFPRGLPNHLTRNHSPKSVARYRSLSFGQREHLGRVDRLDPLAPSKTVIAGGSNGGGRSHLHPFIARTITVRECARLQTFRDDYVFEGTMARQFTQVGNAVPPMLAEIFGRHILQQEFRIPNPSPLIHGAALKHSASLDVLTRRMIKQSRSENPDWIYFTHDNQKCQDA